MKSAVAYILNWKCEHFNFMHAVLLLQRLLHTLFCANLKNDVDLQWCSYHKPQNLSKSDYMSFH